MASTVLILSLITGVVTVTVVQDPPSLDLSVGETAQMSCKIKGAENINISYYYWNINKSQDSTLLENSSRINITSGSLVISPVTTNDTGLYICSVRDSDLKQYIGHGTHLLVREWITDPVQHDHYLYSLLFLIPLLLGIFICLKYLARRGPPAAGGEMGNGKKCRQQLDSDTYLQYSTIFHHPTGVRTKREETRNSKVEEVEYAPVRIAMSHLPIPATHEPGNMDEGDIFYANLKMSLPDVTTCTLEQR